MASFDIPLEREVANGYLPKFSPNWDKRIGKSSLTNLLYISICGCMNIESQTPQEVYHCESPVWLVDVRTPVEFRSLRAEGAINLPLSDLDVHSLQPPPDYHGPLYVICQSGARARQAAQKLSSRFPVVLVEGGTAAWTAAGLPVIRQATTVLSLERQVRIIIGSLVVAGVLLSKLWNPDAIYLSAFVGMGLIFAGVTDICPLAMGVAQLPWNRK